MKSTLKIFLAVCLFSSVTFADGDMTTGGFDGDMTTGGKTCTENCAVSNEPSDPNVVTTSSNSSEPQNDESILTIVQDYLLSLFG